MSLGAGVGSTALIATLPPYVRHRETIARHPAVDALRFNTIMPIAEPKRDVLADLLEVCAGKPLYIDLKGRQLRITRFAYLPFAFVEISRRISVDLPAKVLFKDGEAEIIRIVDGTKLILADRPPRVVGAGEPITILDPSLVIEGYLTDDDREYVAAARALGVHDYLLSFVEQASDLDELRALDPEARVFAKIESRRGLDFVRDVYPHQDGDVRLMAARDDLYLQMGTAKHAILEALEQIITADPEAVIASRILTSLEEEPTVTLGDLADLALMYRLGYRSFMLSDSLCFSERAFARAIAVYAELAAWLRTRR
jgi:hypothetical protein